MAQQYTLKNGGYEPFIGNYGLVPQPPIPEPAAEDNGKVLGVAGGQYALVSGGGGGGGAEPLIVNSTETGIDASFNEIKTALLAGRAVWLLSGDGIEIYESLVALVIDTGAYFCSFGTNATTYTSEDADTDMTPFNGGGGDEIPNY